MKKFAGLVLVGYVLFNSFTAEAQSYAESALIFSRIRPGGSARIQALGGTQVSLGGDYSSAYSNPAGLGMYNRSEFTFTPGYNFASTSSDYLGTSTGSMQSKLVIPGISLVFHSDKGKGALLSGTFGITFNRTNDFNRTFEYGGQNSNNSIIDYFIADATGYDSTQFNSPGPNDSPPAGARYYHPTGVAYDNYLINAIPGNPTRYYSDISVSTITQHEKVQTKGNQNQVTFAYGINLSDKIFLGGGIGIASINYKSSKTYSEISPRDSLLSSLTLVENLTTSGTGLNATIGAIFKPLDIFQFGISIATPTGFFSLTDKYSTSMTTNWKFFPYGSSNLPLKPVLHDEPANSYQFTTPWRLSTGATFFIQKRGFISADAEYVNYGGSKYSPVSSYYTTSTNSFDPDNAEIKSRYSPVFNFRLGAEYRLNSYRLRAGYSYMPDPYKSVQNNVYNDLQSFSGGVGYRASKFYVDLTGVFTQGNNTYRPYTNSPLVTNRNKGTQIMVTVGFPF